MQVAFGAVDAHAAEPTADLELAKAHFKTGELNYDRRQFNEAAKEFEGAYRLSGRAELLYNMGKSYDGAGDMRGALVAYRRFLATPYRPRPIAPSSKAPRRSSSTDSSRGSRSTSSIEGASVVARRREGRRDPARRRLRSSSIPGEHSIEISRRGLFHVPTERVDARAITTENDRRASSSRSCA